MTPEQQKELIARLDEILEDIEYSRPPLDLWVDWFWPEGADAPYIQVRSNRPDTFTGQTGEGGGGKYRVSYYACKSEIVAAIFGLFKSYEEHECREAFTYKGVRIFGPHIDVDVLVDVAGNLDVRS